MSTILKVKGLSKYYSKAGNKINILKNINLTISKNEIVVLMGPSGSGKSTLLNILGTLDSNYTGNIILNGKNIYCYNNLEELRSNFISFIFQFHHLMPEFTIKENLQIPGMISNNFDINTINELTEYIGINDRLDHYPDEISGGERQRVAVVRAFINNPSLVLADEPTGNLDSDNSQLLLNLIVDLKRKYKQSFLIATHDDKFKSIADRVLYLNNAELKEGEK